MLLFLILIPWAWAQPQLNLDIVTSFVKSNGFTSVNIVKLESEPMDLTAAKLVQSLSQQNIQTSVLDIKQLNPEENEVMNEDFIFATINNQDEWKTVLNICSHIRIHSSMVISSMRTCPSELPFEKRNAQTFLFSLSTQELFDVITIGGSNEEVIVNPLKVLQVGSLPSLAIPQADFKGITLLDESLPWMPLFSLTNCNAKGEHCRAGGALGDTSVFLEQMLNLTISFRMNPDDDWGIEPFEVTLRNRSSNFTGVLGSVVKGKSHISISGFYMVAKRTEVMDMAWQHTDDTILVIGDNLPPSLDLSLLLRPFHQEVWIAITLLLCLALLAIFTLNALSTNEGLHHRILTHSLLFFFLLINAFYSGALTMLFASRPEPPFNSLEGAMEAYPTWQLLISMDEAFYSKPNRFHSKTYFDFWQRSSTEPKEEVYIQSNLQGLTRVANEQATLQILQNTFKYLTKDQALKDYSFRIVAEHINQIHISAGLTFNSPLTPAIAQSYLAMRECGMTQRLLRTWGAIPNEGKVKESSSVAALGFGKLILAYIIMGLAFMASLIILCAELLAKGTLAAGAQQESEHQLQEKQKAHSTAVNIGNANTSIDTYY